MCARGIVRLVAALCLSTVVACTGAAGPTAPTSTSLSDVVSTRTPSASDPDETSVVAFPFYDGCSGGVIASAPSWNPDHLQIHVTLHGPSGQTVTTDSDRRTDRAMAVVTGYGHWTYSAVADTVVIAGEPTIVYFGEHGEFDVSGPQTDLQRIAMHRDCNPGQPPPPPPPPPAALTCSPPVTQNVLINSAATVTAAGGLPPYSWTGPVGIALPATSSGVTYSPVLTQVGTHELTVRDSANAVATCRVGVIAPQPPLPCYGTHQPYERLGFDRTVSTQDIVAGVDLYAPGTYTLAIYASIDGGAPIFKNADSVTVVCNTTGVHLSHAYNWNGHPAQRWWPQLTLPSGQKVDGPIFTRP
jgi:hypothetical protein